MKNIAKKKNSINSVAILQIGSCKKDNEDYYKHCRGALKKKKDKENEQQGREPLKKKNNEDYCKEYYKDCRDPLKKNEDYYNGSKLIIQS